MKNINLLSVFFISIILIGCKEKRVADFQYEILEDKSICSLKPQEIYDSNEFSMFDTSFKNESGSFNDELSKKIYAQSLKNLSNKDSKYIFCFSKDMLMSNYLETQIRIELKKGKSFRQYEFINYFCLTKKTSIMNFNSRDKSIRECQ